MSGLGLAQLERARTLLRRTRRLGSVLATSGVQGRWLDRAIQFRGESPEAQVRWLAERLGAGWQRIEGLGDGGAMEQFELALGDGFPLNLSACRVAFPPADWPAQDVLTLLGTGGDRPCLVLGRDPDQCADLSRRCRSPETWWVAPEDGELSALLLAAEPVDAFARLIARYVKLARWSVMITVPLRIPAPIRARPLPARRQARPAFSVPRSVAPSGRKHTAPRHAAGLR
ncbi:hypothetical protein [uncultured Thiodictyon sp.]|uniref:hypothetical protein n=1 Tax=uncultured Thiodictyon sp. TaxID=1846217 RepID=UPI0025DB844F|nr:hypothetical protein [uncultured Thiodictyon sp.]